WGTSWAVMLSTAAAGTIIQMARGASSFATKSASDDDPVAPSSASCFTLAVFRSKTTHDWPPLLRRRTMLAPMRPRPIIPNCIEFHSIVESAATNKTPQTAVAAQGDSLRRTRCLAATSLAALQWVSVFLLLHDVVAKDKANFSYHPKLVVVQAFG